MITNATKFDTPYILNVASGMLDAEDPVIVAAVEAELKTRGWKLEHGGRFEFDPNHTRHCLINPDGGRVGFLRLNELCRYLSGTARIAVVTYSVTAK